jgi:hypothetical protein
MNGYICIHGHFYQPPRENPWLERIEVQDSAHPYHDWNARVHAECYAPNAVSRILDDRSRITGIVNNYEHISFNFGPTLLSWIKENDPDIYRKIIQADQISAAKHGGHGNAIAQAYNHMIMPLANRRDKISQINWGIASFRRHFDRAPEGMWLPETAVDLDTLEILSEYGIRFTILAPRQARRIRPLNSTVWCDVSDGTIDTTMPYLVRSFSITARSPMTWPLADFCRMRKPLKKDFSMPCRPAAPPRRWCMWPPTGKHTAIITGSATWLWPMPLSRCEKIMTWS